MAGCSHDGGPNIAIIGAGSAVFSLSFIRDACLTPRLAGSRITLMDIDEDRLGVSYKLATRYARELDIDLTIKSTLDRASALREADFVVNAALGPGHEQMRAGWEVARQVGYRFGGSLHVMHDESFWINFHQLRLVDSILADVQRICPSAWYIQVANPVLAGMTHVFRRFPDIKAVGLCHGYVGVYEVADALGIAHADFSFDVAGVNHHMWMIDGYTAGESVLPAFEKVLADDSLPTDSRITPVTVDLYHRLGALPLGDTCSPGGGSWPWWYHESSETERTWGEDPETAWTNYYPRLQEKLAGLREAADGKARVSDVLPPERSREQAIPLIESICYDVPRVLFCNISNKRRLMPQLPDDLAVEVPALVSRRGIDGLAPAPLPPGVVAQIQRDRVGPVTTELAAYENADRDLLESLVLMDPWTRSLEQARTVVEQIMALPGNESMADYYVSSSPRKRQGALVEPVID